MQNENGEENFYLLVGAHGQKLNTAVPDFVAEPVRISADAVQQDDWVILYVEDNGIRRISKLEAARPGLTAMSCGSGCCK